MILTPRMWGIKQRIEFLENHCRADQGDYLAEFELKELQIKLDKLARIDKMGLRVIEGGKETKERMG